MRLLGYILGESESLYSLTLAREPVTLPVSGRGTSSTRALAVPRCDRALENARLRTAELAPMITKDLPA